jgi:hypothetical protein
LVFIATLFVDVCLAGAFFAAVFLTGASVEFAALFPAAAFRLGADFFGADVAMVD